MGLFNTDALRSTGIDAANSLFSNFTGIKAIIPGGSNSVQAITNAQNPTRTGVPAEAPIVQNGLRTTPGGVGGLFSGVSPVVLVIGGIVAAALVIAMVRK